MILAVPLVEVDDQQKAAAGSGSSNKGTALLSLLLDDPLPTPGQPRTVVPTGIKELDDVLPPMDESYFTYHGSLTTPPCSENVRWYVFSSPQFISTATLHGLRKALQKQMPKTFKDVGNARPPQDLNGRTVRRFVDPFGDRADQAPLFFAGGPTAHRILSGAFGIITAPPNSLVIAFLAASVTAIFLVARSKWRHAHETHGFGTEHGIEYAPVRGYGTMS
jgi:hypothetical protein